MIRRTAFTLCEAVPKSLSDRFALLHWLANMDFFLRLRNFGRKIWHKPVSSGLAMSYLMNRQRGVTPRTSKTGRAFLYDLCQFQNVIFRFVAHSVCCREK